MIPNHPEDILERIVRFFSFDNPSPDEQNGPPAKLIFGTFLRLIPQADKILL